MKNCRHFVLGVLFLFCGINAFAQQFAIKTNGLMWAMLMPNIGGEIVVGERTSVDVSAFGGYNPYGTEIKLFGLNPELKYWFSGRPMLRQYIGLSVIGTSYDMKIRDRIYDGKAVGGGLSFGYSWLVGERLNIEVSAGLGAVYFSQRRLYYGDNTSDYEAFGKKRENSTGVKIIPAKLAVSISYIIK